MISSFGKWLTRTLLSNPRIRDRIAANRHLMCILFNLAHPDWLFAKLTEEFSPWFYATEYKKIPIQIQKVYHPLCGIAWRTRIFTSYNTWHNEGSVHKDLRVVLSLAQEYIDEVNFCELTEKIQKLIEISRIKRNPSS